MSPSSATASSAMPTGTRLGEFEITGVIGEGGFGIVYSAHDSSLDRTVAIKEYLPAAFASRTTAGTVQVRSSEHVKTFNAGLASFINEARMLAKFSHPGLVEVFRFWEGNGTAYMAMRYYRGVTLREMLRTNPQVVTESWLCETLDPILLALQELHHERCFHRDIAPDNIMVLPNGRSVLMDFGAARRIIGGMTHALTTVLKPGYAPIEQYSDDGSMQQGAWTDIYALGGVLYHAMTGKVPVQAISRMMNDPLKPVSVAARGTFSENLCNAVMKCLAVMPENRFQSIDELRAALGWVTTPVSSTVILQQTSHARAAEIELANQARALAASTQTTAAPARDAGSPLLATPGIPAATSADPLAALIAGGDTVAPSLGAKPVSGTAAAAAGRPATPSPSRSAASSAADSTTVAPTTSAPKRNLVPLVVIGVAAVAAIGAAAYLVMNRQAAPAEPPAVVVPAPAEAPVVKGSDAVPPAAEKADVPSAQAPAEPADSKSPTNDVGAAPVQEPATPTTPVAESKGAEPPKGLVDTGRVDLRIRPWGNVIVDGVAKGASPPVMQLTLSPGSHTIVIQNPAGAPVTKTVEVVAGKSITVRHSFQ